MRTATRLGLYGAGLAAAFGAAFTVADAVVPQRTVDDWTGAAAAHETSTAPGHPGASATTSPTGGAMRGVMSAQDGYLLSRVGAPDEVGETGKLSFRILDRRGEVETSFTTSHEKKLHLVVVRTDGTRFRHVHPTMAADGTWSLPWEWSAAGTYRLYADFVPAGQGEPLTLTRTVEVAGAFAARAPRPSGTVSVDGFTVELTGDLVAGTGTELTLSVSRDGRPVTGLQPYLGAFGHLVALREGDLAYLHVHPEVEEPANGELSGPGVTFVTEAPTPGRYLLYLDFKVDGKVHTAAFVVDTDRAARPAGATDDHPDSGHSPDRGAEH